MLRSTALTAVAFVAALSFSTSASAQMLLMPDTTSDTMVAFDPYDGSVINTNLFALPNTTMIAAVDVGGEVWVSAQSGDAVYRYDLVGNLLGQIGPSFAGGGLDNVRGMNVFGGLVYVTSDGGNNGATTDSVVVFDYAGNHVITHGGLPSTTSPFSVIPWQGGMLVASSGADDDIHWYDLAGVSLGTFHNSASIAFAHQIAEGNDGSVWCAAFTTGKVLKLDAGTGDVLQEFAASGARGVFELYNGTVMWTNNSGAHIYDPVTQTSTLVHAGGGRHLHLYGANPGAANIAYLGDGCDGVVTTTSGGFPKVGNSGFAIRVANVPSLSPVAFAGLGTQAVVAGVDLTVIGMQGCFGHSNVDVGLFAGGPVIGGASDLVVPIPNNAGLLGFTFSAQGVTLSAATTLGFAAGNGLLVEVGN